MNPRTAVQVVLNELERAGLAYMMTGGFVRNLYAIARSTNDADIVVQMEPKAFDVFAHALPAEIELDPQVSFETITGSRRHILKIARSDFRIELFILGEDTHHGERFAGRVRRTLSELGCDAWVARAEDMIIQKLRWFRDKDRDDLRSIIAVQAEALDWPYIEQWADRHGTRERLEQIRASLPPLPPL